MKIPLITVAIIAALLQTSDARGPKRAPNQKAVMSALQNVFSQGNTDRAMQIMQMAKRRSLLEGLPANAMQTMPGPFTSLRNQQFQQCQCQNLEPTNLHGLVGSNLPGLARPVNRPEVMAASLPINRPEVIASKIPLNVPEVAVNMPCNRAELMANVPINQPEVIHIPVPYLVPVREPCATPSTASLISPFLPSASPVSAWAPPTSNLLPPVIPSQTRNHFLRKIPIPPPCI